AGDECPIATTGAAPRLAADRSPSAFLSVDSDKFASGGCRSLPLSVMNWQVYITGDPNLPDDKPMFKIGPAGILLSVKEVLAARTPGQTEQQLASQYPGLTVDHLAAAHAYAAELIKAKTTKARLGALEEWCREFDTRFDRKTREEVKRLSYQMRIWKKILIS